VEWKSRDVSSNGWLAVLCDILEQISSENLRRIDLWITMALVDLRTKFYATAFDVTKQRSQRRSDSDDLR